MDRSLQRTSQNLSGGTCGRENALYAARIWSAHTLPAAIDSVMVVLAQRSVDRSIPATKKSEFGWRFVWARRRTLRREELVNPRSPRRYRFFHSCFIHA